MCPYFALTFIKADDKIKAYDFENQKSQEGTESEYEIKKIPHLVVSVSVREIVYPSERS